MIYKITVIIPVFNTAGFIENCANSLFNQTLSGVEYIFVDDFSYDDSILILKKVISNYPKRQNDIKIIHNTENLGPAMSRNKALDFASGEYVIVVDSDDYVELDMFEKMYTKAIKSKADIVVSDMLIEYPDKTIYFDDYVPESKSDYFPEMLTNVRSSPSLCNKLISRELYLNSECRNNNKAKYMEDRLVSSKIYYFASKIIKIDKPFYHYAKQNKNSLTSRYGSEHFESLMCFWKNMDTFLINNNILEKYNELVLHTKLKDKLKLMMFVDSFQIRKRFAVIFGETNKSSKESLKPSEKIMDFLVRNKLFVFTSVLQKLVKIKSRIL